MFKDLRKGFQVYVLNTSGIPEYLVGEVVNASEPRFETPAQGQKYVVPGMVLDLTIQTKDGTNTYVVPDTQNVVSHNNLTIACSIDPIINQLNAIKKSSQDIINSIEHHKQILEASTKILEEVNPAFAQSAEQDRKIQEMQQQMSTLATGLEDIKNLLLSRSQESKKED